MNNIEIISLIYKSTQYLDLIASELKKDYCKVDDWDVGIRIVANDANEAVLNRLKEVDVPYTIYNDPKSDDYYLNRVYRCWNFAGKTSEYDNICFVNSDNYPVLNPEYGSHYIGGESVQQTLLAREFARQGWHQCVATA